MQMLATAEEEAAKGRIVVGTNACLKKIECETEVISGRTIVTKITSVWDNKMWEVDLSSGQWLEVLETEELETPETPETEELETPETPETGDPVKKAQPGTPIQSP